MAKRRGLEWPKQYTLPLNLDSDRRVEIAFFTLVYQWNKFHRNANIAIDRLATLSGVNVNFIKAVIFKIQTSQPTNYEYTIYLYDIKLPIRKITHLPITRVDYYYCLNQLTLHKNELLPLMPEPCLAPEELKVVKSILKTMDGYVTLFTRIGERVK